MLKKIKSVDEMFWSGGVQYRLAYKTYIFDNGYIIEKWIEGGYANLTPVRLEKKTKINLSQRVQHSTTLIADFKTVDEALSYLKDKLGINFEQKIINKILEKGDK